MNDDAKLKLAKKELQAMKYEMWVENMKNPNYFTSPYQTPVERGYRGSYHKHDQNRRQRAHI